MTELRVELPVKINGVIFTHDIYGQISQLQSENSFYDEIDKIYDNGGIAGVETDIDEINNYFIEIIANTDSNYSTERETRMLSLLHWLREKIIQFKVPKELLTPVK